MEDTVNPSVSAQSWAIETYTNCEVAAWPFKFASQDSILLSVDFQGSIP